MYQNKRNALQRARLSTGLTQEALAERSGYSPDSIRAWESGARLASLEALGILSEVLGAAWLPGVYLREQSSALNDLLPDLVESKVDRQLLRMVADGRIDEVERPVFEEIMGAAGRANRAYYEMRFAARKDHER